MNKHPTFSAFSAIDEGEYSRYALYTSLLSVSTAGRGAVSSEAALAFCRGITHFRGVVW